MTDSAASQPSQASSPPACGEEPCPPQQGGAACVEDAHGHRARKRDPELGRDVPVAVQNQPAAAEDPSEQVLPERELVGAGKAHQRRQPLGQVLDRKGEHVVVQHDHREGARGRPVQGQPDVLHVLGREGAVAVDEGAVVRRGRVEPDDVETRGRGDGDAAAPHDASRGVVAHAVVVSGDRGETSGLQERREDPLVPGQLGCQSTVRDVPGEQHLVDARLDEHSREPACRLVRRLVPADVEVGDVHQGPHRHGR